MGGGERTEVERRPGGWCGGVWSCVHISCLASRINREGGAGARSWGDGWVGIKAWGGGRWGSTLGRNRFVLWIVYEAYQESHKRARAGMFSDFKVRAAHPAAASVGEAKQENTEAPLSPARSCKTRVLGCARQQTRLPLHTRHRPGVSTTTLLSSLCSGRSSLHLGRGHRWARSPWDAQLHIKHCLCSEPRSGRCGARRRLTQGWWSCWRWRTHKEPQKEIFICPHQLSALNGSLSTHKRSHRRPINWAPHRRPGGSLLPVPPPRGTIP